MWHSKIVLALAVLISLSATPVRAAGGEVSIQFQGLGPNAGGVPVLGGRLRVGHWEGSIHSYESDGLAFTGAWRTIWRDNSFLSPSMNLSVRRTSGDLLAGPGLSLALTLPKIGPGRLGVRIDNDLFYSLRSTSFEPEYLLGVTYLIPGASR